MNKSEICDIKKDSLSSLAWVGTDFQRFALDDIEFEFRLSFDRLRTKEGMEEALWG